MLLYMHVRHGVLLRLRQLKGSRDDVQHAGPLSHKIAMWLSSDVLLCVSVETFGSCRAKVWPSDCVVGCRRQPRPGQYPANFSPFRMASAGSLSVTALSKRYADRAALSGSVRLVSPCVHVNQNCCATWKVLAPMTQCCGVCWAGTQRAISGVCMKSIETCSKAPTSTK